MEIEETKVDIIPLDDERLLKFIVSSADGKFLFAGGYEKILTVIDSHSNCIHMRVPLK